MREGHDPVCGLQRSVRQDWKEGGCPRCPGNTRRGARPGTPRYTDPGDLPLGGPFYVRGRAWTDTQILPASRWPHLERRGLPTPIIPWFWILSGPLTHLGGNLRSSYRAGAGPKPEALRLRAPPSLPESSPGPALKAPPPSDPAPNGRRSLFRPAPRSRPAPLELSLH